MRHLFLGDDSSGGRSPELGNRYSYTDEFKAEAVAYARSSDQPRYRIAESLDVSDGALAAWIKDAERDEQPGALSRRAAIDRITDSATDH